MSVKRKQKAQVKTDTLISYNIRGQGRQTKLTLLIHTFLTIIINIHTKKVVHKNIKSL